MRKWLGIGGIVFVAIAIRIWAAVNYFHVDIWSNAGWGEWISLNGSKGFFYNNIWTYSWPTQLPLVNLIYAFCYDLSKDLMIYFLRFGFLLNNLGLGESLGRIYVNWTNLMNSNVTTEIPFKNVFIFTIKLLPILADLGIAGIIWGFTRNKKYGNFWPALFLLSPFSFYVSAFWGQFDALSFLVLLLSFLTIKKSRFASPILLSISLGIKPTSAIFIPIYLYLLYEERKYWIQYLVGITAGILLNIYWIHLFSSEKNLVDFIRGRLWRMVIEKSEPRVTVNSYNFWYLFLGDKAANINEMFLFMQYKIWGLLGLIGVNWTGIKIFIKDKTNNLWLALAVVGIGSWIFGMNMLERYLYAGIMFGLLAAIQNRKLLLPWIGLSLMFWINLYKNWWMPDWFDFLRLLQAEVPLLIQIIYPSVFLLLFAVMIRLVYEKK